MTELFWFSDEQWTRFQPLLPVCKSGFRRVDDQRVISGIIHVLKTGTPWRQTPKEYGPSHFSGHGGDFLSLLARFSMMARMRIQDDRGQGGTVGGRAAG